MYNGEVQKPEVQMIYKEEAVDPDKYTVIYSDENSENAGTYTVTIMMKIGSGFTTEPCEAEYTIRKAGGVLRPSSFLVRQRSFWALRLFGAPKKFLGSSAFWCAKDDLAVSNIFCDFDEVVNDV